MESTALIQSVSIENLLQCREGILSRFNKMQDLAEEISQLSKTLQYNYPPHFEWEGSGQRHGLLNRYRNNEKEESRTLYRKAIDRLAWAMLMKESGMLTYMDAKAKEEWEKGLREGETPELTYANIMATFKGLHEKKGELFDRGVINVFRSLSWDYKTNSPFKLTKKIIVGYCEGWHGTGKKKLDDLVRCFHVLDDKPEPEYRHTITAIARDVDFYENDYLSVKFYRNGNGHVTFKRMDLVQQLNETIARHFPFHIPQDNKQAA